MFPLIGILFNFLNSEIRNTYVPKNSDFRNPVPYIYTQGQSVITWVAYI